MIVKEFWVKDQDGKRYKVIGQTALVQDNQPILRHMLVTEEGNMFFENNLFKYQYLDQIQEHHSDLN